MKKVHDIISSLSVSQIKIYLELVGGEIDNDIKYDEAILKSLDKEKIGKLILHTIVESKDKSGKKISTQLLKNEQFLIEERELGTNRGLDAAEILPCAISILPSIEAELKIELRDGKPHFLVSARLRSFSFILQLIKELRESKTTTTNVNISNSKNVISGSHIIVSGDLHLGDKTEIGQQINNNGNIGKQININENHGEINIGGNSTEKNIQEGVVLHSIPKKMQYGNIHRCIIRIGFDKELILKNLPNEISDIGLKENVRVSENMEVTFLKSSFFEISQINSPNQIVEREEITEWNFDVKPLQLGKFPLTFKIAILFKSGRKEVVLTESISVITERVNSSQVFVEANLKLNNNRFENLKKLKSETRKLISLGRVKEALTQLKDESPKHIQNEIIQLQEQFTSLQQKERISIISFEEARIWRAKITNSILGLLDDELLN